MSGVIGDNIYRASGVVASAAVSQDYVLLSELDTSVTNPTTVSFDNVFTSDYQVYKVEAHGIQFTAGSTGQFHMRYTDTGGTALTGSDYYWGAQGYYGSTLWDYNDLVDDQFNFATWSYTTAGSAQGTGAIGSNEFTVYDPLDAANDTAMTWTSCFWEAGGNYVVQQITGAMMYTSASAIGGMDFYHVNSLTFTKGKFQIYGMKGTI